MSTGNGSQLDYLTLKVNGNSGNIVWQQRYDYNNLYDVPVDLSFDLSGNIIVTGTSAQSISKWDIAILKYSSNGSLLDEKRIGNSSLGFEKPSGLVKDINGNLLVSGTTTTNGQTFDIKTTKLDNNLNILWSQIYDGGEVDSVSTIQTDPLGNIVLTGWQSNVYGGTEPITIQYDNLGNLNWVKKRTSALTTTKAKSKSLIIDENGNIFIAIEEKIENKSTIFVTQYNSLGETKWTTKITNEQAITNSPIKLLLNENEELYLTSLSKKENGNNYNAYKLKTLSRDLTPVLDNNENPTYLENEVIIKFKPNIINSSFLNDKSVRFSSLGNIIDDSNIVQQIANKIGVENLGNHKVIKIHPNRTPNQSTSTTRFGKTVQTPDFYNSLILVIPKESRNSELPDIIKELKDPELKCYIRYAEINPVLTLDMCDPDDNLYPTQSNLHATPNYPNGHINMESAWCIAGAGSSDIKVSIMDTGIRWSHEDFGNGTFAGSVITAGINYQNGSDISTNNENDIGDHGTKVASIVGSIRNNGLGVAGIAGGSGSQDGVQLIAQRVFFTGVPISTLIQGLEEAHEEYEVDIINISGGYNSPSTSDYFALREVVHHLNRMGVIISGSRGNNEGNASAPRLPGTIQDEWVMCVGGTNTEGNFNPECRIGEPIDFAAPSRWQLTRSAANYVPGTSNASDQAYGGISFTSGATPHATGLAALIASYSNTDLHPEDIEYILQETARDVVLPPAGVGYDDQTGFGLLNGGAALELIESPLCNVYHFGTDTDNHSRDIELVATETNIELTEPFTTETGQIFDVGLYTADVYKITTAISSSLPANYNITHSWERHSSSTVFLNSENGQLQPLENVEIIGTPSNLGATLEGYIYYLKNGNCTIEGWIPSSPEEADLTYSVIGCTTTNTKNLLKQSFKIYPNPTADFLNISSANLSDYSIQNISIIDIAGREMITVSEITLNNDIQVNLKNIPNGLYSCLIQTDEGIVVEKFVKI